MTPEHGIDEGSRNPFDLGAWKDALTGASLAFLVLLALGASLLGLAKIAHPALAAGAGIVEVFRAIVIASLAVLRAPIHYDGVIVSAAPLGGLALFAFGVRWSARASRGGGQSASASILTAVSFALICGLAALLFRTSDVHAGAVGAVVWGGLWAVAFAPDLPWARVVELGRRFPGLVTALVMAGVTAVASSALTLAALITRLAGTGFPASYSRATAAGAAGFVLAFSPNIVALATALGMGVPLEVGARVRFSGRFVAALNEYSLWSWNGGSTPAWAFAFVAAPAIGCITGGIWTRVRHGERGMVALGLGAPTFAVAWATLTWLAQMRLGARLIGPGLAAVGTQPLMVLLAAFVWAAVGGSIGWFLAGRRRREKLR